MSIKVIRVVLITILTIFMVLGFSQIFGPILGYLLGLGLGGMIVGFFVHENLRISVINSAFMGFLVSIVDVILSQNIFGFVFLIVFPIISAIGGYIGGKNYITYWKSTD